MANITLAAEATSLILNGTPILDLVDGDTVVITPVNPVTNQLRSSRSLNIQKRSDSDVHDVVFRVPKYSDADIFMQSAINQRIPTVFNGSCKENYLRDSVEAVTTWTLRNGSITTRPTDTRNNQDGNNMMEYTIRFNQATRV